MQYRIFYIASYQAAAALWASTTACRNTSLTMKSISEFSPECSTLTYAQYFFCGCIKLNDRPLEIEYAESNGCCKKYRSKILPLIIYASFKIAYTCDIA